VSGLGIRVDLLSSNTLELVLPSSTSSCAAEAEARRDFASAHEAFEFAGTEGGGSRRAIVPLSPLS
jgi:hypothetical protein